MWRTILNSRVILTLTLAAAAAPLTTASAQTLGWHKEIAAGANLFFGNTQQRLATLRTSIAHADSTFELSGTLRFAYGEASADTGRRFVNTRNWLVSSSYTNHPFAQFSTFMTAAVESSLQQAIHRRSSVGAGETVTVLRDSASDIRFSAGFLGEHTVPSTNRTLSPDENFARWTGRVKLLQKVDDKLTLTHETFYQPRATEISVFTVASTSALTYQMSKAVGVQMSLTDNYDSGATDRGARSNNDGQMVFGVLGKF
jgi:hypothetical protein